MGDLSLTEVARTLGVSPATLRRWVSDDIVPLRDGRWTPAAVAQARLVARLRGRGPSLAQVGRAARAGRRASGYLEDLFPRGETGFTVRDAARETGLAPEMIGRIWLPARVAETLR